MLGNSQNFIFGETKPMLIIILQQNMVRITGPNRLTKSLHAN